MCPAVPAYVDAYVGGEYSNVQAKAFITHTHTCFSFFTKKKRNPCECFPCPIFPRLFSLMPKHVNLPSGHFLHMRMLNRFIFPPPPSRILVQIFIVWRCFAYTRTKCSPHLTALLHCTFRQKSKEGKAEKISNLSLRTHRSFYFPNDLPFFSRIFLSLSAACPVQRKISNYFFFFLQTDVIPPSNLQN